MLAIFPSLRDALYQIAGSDLAGGGVPRRCEIARSWWRRLRLAGLSGPAILSQLREAGGIGPAEAAELARELAGGVKVWAEPTARAALARCLAQMPALLRRELQVAGSLQTTPAGPADLLPFLPRRVPTLLPNTRWEDLGDLVLGEFRGGGNFAEVYEARNPSRPDEPLRAVKLSFHPDGRHLLGHEAWMSDLIRRRGCQRGVLPVLALCLDTDVPALVYPAVSGFNLLEILEGWHRCGRVPEPRWVAVLMHRLALVLGDVHACLFVHRDIKPGNLMIGRFDGARQDILLIDLGIAGPAAGLSGDDWPQGAETRRIIDRVLIYSHSPLYASPGQRRHDVSRACDDVYAAGVIAIRAIAGDFVNRVDRIPWQSILAARGTPREFLDVLAACVAPEEHRRPADGHDLAARLEEVLHDAEW
jgi:serine/threonine protein kinase